MSILFDSFSVLIDHGWLIAGILLIMLVGQMFVWSTLKIILTDKLTFSEYYSLSATGWMLPVFLMGLIWILGKSFSPQVFRAPGIFILLAILALIFFLRTRNESSAESKTIFLVLLLLFGLFIFLRLAFVAKAAIPQYFDSAQHYLIIKNILENPSSSTRVWLPTVYYHIGFHVVAAWIISVLHADILHSMLILGQWTLAVIPLSVFFLIRHETQSNSAGLFAVLLAAFGWYMPAHAMDWGKYPALTSLTLIPFVVSLAYLSVRYKKALSSGTYVGLNGILLTALIITVLTHSRSLVIFGFVILAWTATTAWQKLPGRTQWIFWGLAIAGIGAELSFIRTKDVLGPLFDPYINKGLWITLIVLFLSIVAQWTYPKLAFSILLMILLLLGSLFIPVNGIPGYIDLTLLDRPFVEMILYLPLSLLGGLGFAGLLQQSQTGQVHWGTIHFLWSKAIGVLLVGVLLANALFSYEVYPSGCCNIVSRDDMLAIDWIDKNLPADARILTASTELRVLATDAFQGSAGADAGTWINPLTSRPTLALPYTSDFSQPATWDTLCRSKVNYIYVGDSGLTFDNTKIAPHPEWYQVLLSMPKVKVYQVIGCK